MKWEKWHSVVELISEGAGEDFSIVYMDFVTDVKDLETCFHSGHNKHVKSYTGKGMSAAEKADVSKRFRYHVSITVDQTMFSISCIATVGEQAIVFTTL